MIEIYLFYINFGSIDKLLGYCNKSAYYGSAYKLV